VDITFPVPVDHPGFPPRREHGRIAELIFRGVQLVGVEVWILTQHTPRQSAIFVANAEKAAEHHDRVGNLPGEFIDHDTLDRAQFFSIATANRRALDFVTCDQAGQSLEPSLRIQQHLSFLRPCKC